MQTCSVHSASGSSDPRSVTSSTTPGDDERAGAGTVELTVLGCSGSFNGPKGGACSGYLVRSGETSIWLDCGNGTFGHLQQHIAAEDLTAVVVTHEHPDHCVDIYGLHV